MEHNNRTFRGIIEVLNEPVEVQTLGLSVPVLIFLNL
jgi:hypothetical protein